MQVSHNEYIIMELLWKEDRPLSRAEILKGTPGRNWNPASVHLILNSMLSKNLIKITDESKTYGRTYESIITEEEYLRQCVDESLPDKSNRDRLMGVVMALVNRDGVKEEDIESLENMLSEKKEELAVKKSKRKKK